jgi:chromosome transmission fidelity protein 18
MSSYSAGIPSSFDPALLYSEYDCPHNAPNSTSRSDDIEALQACIEEDKIKKSQRGVVIQHRAWKLVDIFRSEGEHSFGTAYAIWRKHQY